MLLYGQCAHVYARLAQLTRTTIVTTHKKITALPPTHPITNDNNNDYTVVFGGAPVSDLSGCSNAEVQTLTENAF